MSKISIISKREDALMEIQNNWSYELWDLLDNKLYSDKEIVIAYWSKFYIPDTGFDEANKKHYLKIEENYYNADDIYKYYKNCLDGEDEYFLDLGEIDLKNSNESLKEWLYSDNNENSIFAMAEKIDKTLFDDIEIMETLVKVSGYLIQFTENQSILNSRDLILEAVKRDGRSIECVPNPFRDDKEIMLEAVRNDEWALEYASEKLKNHKDIVLEAVKKNGYVLKYASDELKDDVEVIETAINSNPIAIEYASLDYRFDIAKKEKKSLEKLYIEAIELGRLDLVEKIENKYLKMESIQKALLMTEKINIDARKHLLLPTILKEFNSINMEESNNDYVKQLASLLIDDLLPNYFGSLVNEFKKNITFNNKRNELKEDLSELLENDGLINDKDVIQFLITYLLQNNKISEAVGDNRVHDFVDITRNHILENYIDDTMNYPLVTNIVYPMSISLKDFPRYLKKGIITTENEKPLGDLELLLDVGEENPELIKDISKYLYRDLLKTIPNTLKDFAFMIGEVDVNDNNQIIIDFEKAFLLCILTLSNNPRFIKVVESLKDEKLSSIFKKANRLVRQERFYIYITDYNLSKQPTEEDYNKLIDLIYKNRVDFINRLINAL